MSPFSVRRALVKRARGGVSIVEILILIAFVAIGCGLHVTSERDLKLDEPIPKYSTDLIRASAMPPPELGSPFAANLKGSELSLLIMKTFHSMCFYVGSATVAYVVIFVKRRPYLRGFRAHFAGSGAVLTAFSVIVLACLLDSGSFLAQENRTSWFSHFRFSADGALQAAGGSILGVWSVLGFSGRLRWRFAWPENLGILIAACWLLLMLEYLLASLAFRFR